MKHDEKGRFIKGYGKHLKSFSREYRIWWDMINRCTKPKTKRYDNYGGRGIGVCERWLNFENFYADMGDRPSIQHSIERINNDSGYSKENCKWATRHEQYRNRRTNKFIIADGQKMIVRDAEILYKIGKNHIGRRARKYRITHQEAFNEIIAER